MTETNNASVWKTYRRLVGYLKPYRGRFALGILGGAMFAATNTGVAGMASRSTRSLLT